MLKLRDGIVELYRKVATSIPTDVEEALKRTQAEESGPLARESLDIILKNISLARTTSRPLCQDTGFPVFFVKVPKGLSHQLIREVIRDATRLATQKVPLRPNAVNSITEKNTGDNVGELFPLIYTEEVSEQTLTVDLMLKGGGSENLGQLYKLPAVLDIGEDERVTAERDFEGVRMCVMDAVFKAQGKGCPPYTIGIAIGGAKDQVTALSKRQLMRRLNDMHPDVALAALEARILQEVNTLGIGSLGFGGRTTAIGVKIAAADRHPASYFVDVSFACWANRRGKLIW
ncbi:MAG: fumarate hydratase [Alphaproteobacteria bacterium]|uniref:Fumarate hydratase n=1 Tax=Candidatus Nitrobium versatile TaxID=2884831 RepID=A0A953JC76_9BACT|nr:fumarate hydratase [Candidatus Nitrobium versatile]